MVFPRRGKTDAPFGRVRLLPVITHGDSRARPLESRRCVARLQAPRVPVGTAAAANPD
jgi:hypothetical protein